MVRRRNNRLLILEQLVIDSNRFGFTEQESLSYIESRTGGKGIARSRYYAIKKDLSKNQLRDYKNRMAYQTKLGIVINHFKRIDELEYLQAILLKTLHFETSKPKEDQSLFGICKIASNLDANTRLLVEMNVGSPIIDQIKEEIDKRLNGNDNLKREIFESGSEDPPGAMTLPKNFVVSSVYCQDNDGGTTTRKKPSDRVF